MPKTQTNHVESVESIEDIVARIAPVESVAKVCLNGALLAEYDEVLEEYEDHEEWERSSLSDTDPREPIRLRLNDLRDQIRASRTSFRFRAIDDETSSDLIAAHPPKKNEKGEDEGAWNPLTYPPALVAKCAIQPAMTEKQAAALFKQLNLDQRNQIFGAAMRANLRLVDIPFFAAASVPAADSDQS